MAVLATAGFAIGLAFQGTLSNFSAGILLLVFRPFKVGDSVNIASVIGRVNEIDLFTTTLDTPDNRRLIIPNSTIASSTIENISYHPHRRVEVIVGVEYSANVEQTRQALNEAIESMSDMVIPGEGRGYQIILSNLGASSVDWIVRAWVAKDNFHAAKERVTHQIKATLAQYRIGIPFPQMHLHMSAPIAKAIQANSAQDASTPEQSKELSAQNLSGGRVDSPSLSIPTVHSGSTNKVRPRVRGDSADRNS
jgi:small conductance mechanosensitive channel